MDVHETTQEQEPIALSEVELLVKQLRGEELGEIESEERVRLQARAAEELGRLAEDGSDAALVALVEAFEAESPLVRCRAVYAVSRFANPGAEAIKGLVGRLEDEDAGVRAEAAEALGRIGHESAQAAAQLHRLIKDDADASVRRWAVYALARVAANKGAGASALVQVLTREDEESEVRREAAEGLGRLGQKTDEVSAALLALVDADDYRLARFAEEALDRLGVEIPRREDEAAPEPEVVEEVEMPEA